MKKNIIRDYEKIYLFNKEEEILKISKNIKEAIVAGIIKMKNNSKNDSFLKENNRYSLTNYIEKEIKVKVPIFNWIALILKYNQEEDSIYLNNENEFAINREKKKLFKIIFDENKIKNDSYIYFYINLEKEDIKTIL